MWTRLTRSVDTANEANRVDVLERPSDKTVDIDEVDVVEDIKVIDEVNMVDGIEKGRQ